MASSSVCVFAAVCGGRRAHVLKHCTERALPYVYDAVTCALPNVDKHYCLIKAHTNGSQGKVDQRQQGEKQLQPKLQDGEGERDEEREGKGRDKRETRGNSSPAAAAFLAAPQNRNTMPSLTRDFWSCATHSLTHIMLRISCSRSFM